MFRSSADFLQGTSNLFPLPWVGEEGGQVHFPACRWSLTDEGLLVLLAELWVNLRCRGKWELPSPSAWGRAHISSGNSTRMGESLGPEDIAGTWDTSSASCFSVALHTCDSCPPLYLRFVEAVGVLWACGKQNVLQTFSGTGIAWVVLFLEVCMYHVWTQKHSRQIRSSGICLVSLNHTVDQFLFVCYLQLLHHKA